MKNSDLFPSFDTKKVESFSMKILLDLVSTSKLCLRHTGNCSCIRPRNLVESIINELIGRIDIGFNPESTCKFTYTFENNFIILTVSAKFIVLIAL